LLRLFEELALVLPGRPPSRVRPAGTFEHKKIGAVSIVLLNFCAFLCSLFAWFF
jgi:hypothetical protein